MSNTTKLPHDFDLIEARQRPFSENSTLAPSRQWVMEQVGSILTTLEGLPCGVARLILDEAGAQVNLVAERAATWTEFRPGSRISREVRDE
jgi:hypothetical protein